MEKQRKKKRRTNPTKGNKSTVVYYPPCELVPWVNFTGGVCPFSNCTDCKDCISNDHDMLCVEWLRDSDTSSFGKA